MPKFRKKPVVIEAWQWTEAMQRGLEPWPPGTWMRIDSGQLVIPTLEGVMAVSVGEWIIRGVKGEYYPCKPDIFAAT